MIIIDYQWDGEGLQIEAEACISASKADRTIVLFPHPREPNYLEIKNETLAGFIRLVCNADIIGENVFYHPLTKDLFESILHVGSLPSAVSSGLLCNGS